MESIVIAHNYQTNSFASMSYYLANHLCEIGYRVVFISKDPYFQNIQELHKGNGVLVLCSWPNNHKSTGLKDFFFFVNLSLKYKPKVVIGHHNGTIISVIASKLLFGKKIITADYHHVCTNSYLEDHQGPKWRIDLFLFRKKLLYNLFCDHIICPSPYALEDVKTNFNHKNPKMILNPLPDRYIPISRFRKEDEITIGFLGRIIPCKNILWLLDQFKSYQTLYPKTKIKLKIAGDGFQKDQLERKIQGMTGVTYLGKITYKEVDGFIQSSDFTIVPSTHDNLPTVITESLMHGVPTLDSNNVGSIPFLKDGLDSLFINLSNEKAVQKVFERVESLPAEKLELMRSAARETYLEYFLMKDYLNHMENLVQSSISYTQKKPQISPRLRCGS